MKKLVLFIALGLCGSVLFAQTKTVIKVSDLQKPITEYIAKNYSGYTTEAAYKLDNKGIMNYETIMVKGATKEVLVFDKDGKFLKKEVLKNEAPAATKQVKKAEAKPASTPAKQTEKKTETKTVKK